MPRRKSAAIPPAPRKTLLEWIEFDDGDTTGSSLPARTQQARALHAQILPNGANNKNEATEPLQPPSGLRLVPLG